MPTWLPLFSSKGASSWLSWIVFYQCKPLFRRSGCKRFNFQNVQFSKDPIFKRLNFQNWTFENWTSWKLDHFENWTILKIGPFWKLDLLKIGPFENWSIWKLIHLKIGPFVCSHSCKTPCCPKTHFKRLRLGPRAY